MDAVPADHVGDARDPVGEATGSHLRSTAILERLQEAHGQAMYGFALRLSLTEVEAADAVQETLYRLWRALSAGPPIDDPVGWSFRTLYRIAMDQHRLARRVRALTQRLRPASEAVDPAADDEVRAVWTEVDRLPERQRQVLYLRYRADLPFERIGDVLGITPGAARTLTSRGLERLRDRLGDGAR